MYVVKLPNASLHGDGFARAGAEPDDNAAWVICQPFVPRPQPNGTYAYDVPATVRIFPSAEEARSWKQRRVEYQKSRGRTAGNMYVVSLAGARKPMGEGWL
jgi:hypothetical protein